MTLRTITWALGITALTCSLACGPLDEADLTRSERMASTGSSDLLPGTEPAPEPADTGEDLMPGTTTRAAAQESGDLYTGPGPAVGDCSPRQTPLTTDGGNQAGRVSVTNDEKNLIVSVRTANRYQLLTVRVYAGPGPVPAAADLFPIKQTQANPVKATSVSVPLSKLSASCGHKLTLAVHVELLYLGSEVIVTDSGWAEGPTRLSEQTPDAQLGWIFEHPVCCPPLEEQP